MSSGREHAASSAATCGRVRVVIENVYGAVAHLKKVDWPVMDRSAAPSCGTRSMPYFFSSALISASVSHIGTSIATVTLSLVSMNR